MHKVGNGPIDIETVHKIATTSQKAVLSSFAKRKVKTTRKAIEKVVL